MIMALNQILLLTLLAYLLSISARGFVAPPPGGNVRVVAPTSEVATTLIIHHACGLGKQ